MEIKTIWQPVPPWPEKQKLITTRLPVPDRKKVIDYKPKRKLGALMSNEMRKWIVQDGIKEIKKDIEKEKKMDARFDWENEYRSIVDFYAKLAVKKGWLEYIRGAVKEKQNESELFKNLGKDVGNRIKELETKNSITKEDYENSK